MSSSRAQSETIGFVLVFALMVASIGIVYTAGFSGLQDARDVERVNNAERAFEVMADNMDDITYRGAPSRATELRLADATLGVTDPITIRLNDTETGLDVVYSVRPIVYDAGTGERIIYVQGSIIRESNANRHMLRSPSMLVNTNRTVIPVLETREPDTGSVGGSKTVLVRANHAVTSLIYTDDDPTPPLWLNVTSPRTDVWIDHLETESGISDCRLVNDTAACRIDTGRIHITRVQIDVELG